MNTNPTPAEAAAQLVKLPHTPYDEVRRLEAFILSETEVAHAEANVRTFDWQDRDKVVPKAMRDVRSKVADFITSGKDFHWFLLGLEVATELQVPESLPTGETRTSKWGREFEVRRKIGRSDVAAYIVTLKAEEADELQWRLDNEPDEPIKWADPTGKPATKHAHWQQEHDERWADIERYVVEMTPYRLWSIVNPLEEQAVDELRADLISLFDNQGDLGSTLSRIITEGFDKAMRAWGDE